MKRIAPILLSCALACSCGEPTNPSPSPATNSVAAAPQGHGEGQDLGVVQVCGLELHVVKFEGAFEIHGTMMPTAALAKLNVYLWLESKDGTQLSAPEKGHIESGKLHFHASPRGEKEPYRVVVRVRKDGADERASLPLDGHGHEHADGPHHGLIAGFSGGGTNGFLELKLHDDKGDLELWLAQDRAIAQPFDLSLDTSVEVQFVDVDGRVVSLRPRDLKSNEDENGKPNIRAGKTNYFIYPTEPEQDASWLQGTEFQSIVVVRFNRDGQSFTSDEFVLQPHAH